MCASISIARLQEHDAKRPEKRVGMLWERFRLISRFKEGRATGGKEIQGGNAASAGEASFAVLVSHCDYYARTQKFQRAFNYANKISATSRRAVVQVDLYSTHSPIVSFNA